MPNALTSTLLLAAVCVWWLVRQAQAKPIVTICPGCGDLIEHVPGVFFCCPSCGTWRLG